jgi:translation initiation factor IF-3
LIRKKAKELDTDIILLNDQAKPAVCKLMNYKETLYRRFIKEILKKTEEGLIL